MQHYFIIYVASGIALFALVLGPLHFIAGANVSDGDAIYSFFGNVNLAKITMISVLVWFWGIVLFPALYDISRLICRGIQGVCQRLK